MRQRDHLVLMANQIARNFATMRDLDAALATADHVASFWEPRMIAALIDDTAGLSPVATQAFKELRERGAPPSQTRATDFADVAGGDRSDAG